MNQNQIHEQLLVEILNTKFHKNLFCSLRGEACGWMDRHNSNIMQFNALYVKKLAMKGLTLLLI